MTTIFPLVLWLFSCTDTAWEVSRLMSEFDNPSTNLSITVRVRPTIDLITLIWKHFRWRGTSTEEAPNAMLLTPCFKYVPCNNRSVR